MDRDSILQALRQFVIEHSNLDDPEILQGDTDLFEAGLLDSLMAVSIVAYCEETFGCQLDLSELSRENFSSLNALADCVLRNIEGLKASPQQ